VSELICLLIGFAAGWILNNLHWHAFLRDRDNMEAAQEKRRSEAVRDLAARPGVKDAITDRQGEQSNG